MSKISKENTLDFVNQIYDRNASFRAISSKHSIKGKEAEKIIKRGADQEVVDKLYRVMKRIATFDQSEPPRKGVFATMTVKEAEEGVNKTHNRVFNALKKRSKGKSSLSNKYKKIIEGEMSQVKSKGPVVVNFNDAREMLNKITDRSSHDLYDKNSSIERTKVVQDIDYVVRELVSYDIEGKGVRTFDHMEAGEHTDHTKTRGMPPYKSGNARIKSPSDSREITVDELIAESLGNDTLEIAQLTKDYIEHVGLMISLTGNRLQSPNKYRFINIVYAQIQYLGQPIINDLTGIFKEYVPYASAGNDPVTTQENIWNMAMNLDEDYVPFSIDYSGFDQLVDPNIICALMEAILRIVYNDAEGIEPVMQVMRLTESLKVMAAPTGMGSAPYELVGVKNLLLSGILYTSFIGTNYNNVLSSRIHADLGSNKPLRSGLRLGDDTVIGLSREVVESLGGYERTLEAIETSIAELGAVVNAKKQMPKDLFPGFIYLQRYYNVEDEIPGLYSIIRSINSIVYAERYPQAIPGVANEYALQNVGQMASINNAYMHFIGEFNIDDISDLAIKAGFEIDNNLYSVFKQASEYIDNDELAGRAGFTYLCAAAGGYAVVRADHSAGEGVQSAFNVELSGKADNILQMWPILTHMARVARDMNEPLNEKYNEFFEMKVKMSSGGSSKQKFNEIFIE